MTAVIRSNGSEKVPYSFQDYDVHISRGRISDSPNYTFPVHWHDDIELTAVLKGWMEYTVNNEKLTVSEGEGIFINSHQLHGNRSPVMEECEYLCLVFHPTLLCANSFLEREYISPLIGNSSYPYVKLTDDPWQQRLCDEIKFIYHTKEEPAAPLVIQSHLYSIWSILFENIEKCQKASADSGNLSSVRQMVSYIQQHYQDKVTLAEIADAGFVGISKCCRLFRQYMNQTPIAYLNTYRLDKSLEMIRTTDRSIAEIANEAGFGHPSYFAGCFQAYFGVLPTEIRKEQKRNSAENQPSLPAEQALS